MASTKAFARSQSSDGNGLLRRTTSKQAIKIQSNVRKIKSKPSLTYPLGSGSNAGASMRNGKIDAKIGRRNSAVHALAEYQTCLNEEARESALSALQDLKLHEDIIVSKDDVPKVNKITPTRTIQNGKDTYKYSLFEPDEEKYVEKSLSPKTHIQIAQASMQNSLLGIRAKEVVYKEVPKVNLQDLKKHKTNKSKRFSAESYVILVYEDREPIFVPKLDFSSLPNFRRPRHYHPQHCVKAQMKKVKGGKHSGLVGFLGIKF